MTLIRMMLARLVPYRLQVSIVLALIVVQTSSACTCPT